LSFVIFTHSKYSSIKISKNNLVKLTKIKPPGNYTYY